MKVSTFGKLGLCAGMAALALGAVVAPAQADPTPGTFGTLVGLGSDTTQAVVGGLATAIGGNVLASYDATGSASVLTRAGGVAVPRANNSGGGRDLLRVAIGQTETAAIPVFNSSPVTVTTSTIAGQVQFARSSGGAGSADVADDGVLTYIPFAVDAVSYATAPNSVIPTDLTKAQIVSIFKGELTQVIVNGSSTHLEGPAYALQAGDVATPITTFLPAVGSGTRSYWLGQMGITEANISAGTYPNLKDKDFAGNAVQEHQGGSLVSGTDAQDSGAIAPFSIAQWVAQGNAKTPDLRAGVRINAVNSQAATTGSAGSFALNPSYNAFTRPVYNIVPSVLADDPTSEIAKTFVGSTSRVCQQTGTITAFGFGLLTGSTACGDTTTRAYKPSTSETGLTLSSSSVVSGQKVTANVSVSSVGNGGGTVRLYNGSTLLGSVPVAAGSTTGSGSITTSTVGVQSVTAVFLPNLLGVASSTSPASTLEVTPVPVVPAVASSVKVASSAKPVVGRSFTLTATVAASKTPAGSVAFYDGTRKLATVKVASAKAALALKATKTSYAIKAFYTSSAPTVVKSSTSAVVTVKVAKATPKVSFTAPTKVAKGAYATLKITVSATGVTPTGKATIKDGKKVIKTVTLKGGKATVKLPRLKAGKHTLVVTYTGSATVNAKASAAKTVTQGK
ncbi:Ig-like domain repeat protein [Cellulomonas edaphi]|uniref:Ig-like domain repeat protein n=1 Tax=Cellulomonas edaphi TaxID=3053468 RepID=A0ABT7S4V1_9CELL|nr:Ig-like domain repeat protein [Cellulomons edaphi]MDM7830630.1 Ig-like domain repeat protein [Cellulomons edaphi]